MATRQFASQTSLMGLCGDLSIETIIQQSLAHLPVTPAQWSLRVNENISNEQLTETFRCILETERHAMVLCRFCLGDLYNSIDKKYGARKETLAHIHRNFGDKLYQTFRTYGWVANKWPIHERNAEHGWTYWLQNKPGQPRKSSKDIATPALKIVGRRQSTKGEILLLEGENKRRYTAVLEPVQEGEIP